jgi:hypothetical protein
VSPFALFLALVCAVRPTALAAVAALLASERPRRLLLVYVIAGVVVSVAGGLLLVLVFRTAAVKYPQPRAGVEIALGLLAILGAMAALRDARRPKAPKAPKAVVPGARPGFGARMSARLRDPSATTAAAAGILTHLPGLFYLMALNAIIAEKPAPGSGIAQVLIFNAIWFALPVAALLSAVRSPEKTEALVRRGTAWAAENSRRVLPFILVGLGIYFIARGLLDLG